MLRSKKAKSLIPKTAKDCNASEELVGDVVDFYYTELRKKMENLEDTSIGVPSLGTFRVSRPKLAKSVQSITNLLSDSTPETFKLVKRFQLTTELRDKQQKLLDKLQKDKDERDQRKKDLEQQG